MQNNPKTWPSPEGRFSQITRHMNLFQIMIGIFFLIIGALVYLIDRPFNSTYFVYNYNFLLNFHNIIPNIFGSLSNSLPDFIHVFSFIMITAGVLSCGKKGGLIVSICWLFIDISFEIGQKFPSIPLKFIPNSFSNIPILEATKYYFQEGTFDIRDLFAIMLGSIIAYSLILITISKRKVVIKN